MNRFTPGKHNERSRKENVDSEPVLLEVKSLLLDMKRRLEPEKKQKDTWDKAGIVAQFLSGVVVAIMGTLIAYNVDNVQNVLAEKQIEIAQRTQFAEYLRLISDAYGDDEKRSSLIRALDLAVPDYRDQIAQHYAVRDPSAKVREAAIRVLASNDLGRTFLSSRLDEAIAEEDRVAILTSLGREVPEVRVRMFEVDDLGRIKVNGEEVAQVSYGNDSGWIDVTHLMRPSAKNRIVGEIFNSPYGGWSGHLQVSAAGGIIDPGRFGRNSCPCNAAAGEIEVVVETDERGRIKTVTPGIPRYL